MIQDTFDMQSSIVDELKITHLSFISIKSTG